MLETEEEFQRQMVTEYANAGVHTGKRSQPGHLPLPRGYPPPRNPSREPDLIYMEGSPQYQIQELEAPKKKVKGSKLKNPKKIEGQDQPDSFARNNPNSLNYPKIFNHSREPPKNFPRPDRKKKYPKLFDDCQNNFPVHQMGTGSALDFLPFPQPAKRKLPKETSMQLPKMREENEEGLCPKNPQRMKQEKEHMEEAYSKQPSLAELPGVKKECKTEPSRQEEEILPPETPSSYSSQLVNPLRVPINLPSTPSKPEKKISLTDPLAADESDLKVNSNKQEGELSNAGNNPNEEKSNQIPELPEDGLARRIRLSVQQLSKNQLHSLKNQALFESAIPQDPFSEIPTEELFPKKSPSRAVSSKNFLKQTGRNAPKRNGTSLSRVQPKKDEKSKKLRKSARSKQGPKGKPRGSYNMLNLAERCEVIAFTKVYGIDAAHRQFNICKSRIRRYSQQGANRKKGGGRKTMDPEMEERLLSWIEEVAMATTSFPSRGTIKEKAKSFSQVGSFLASKGWCDKFFKRNQDILDGIRHKLN